jgi:opacity protein-like surface antigen
MMRLLAGATAGLVLSVGVASAQNIAAEVYGGIAFRDGSGLNYVTTAFPVDRGRSYGVGVYTNQWMGAELGFDLMATDRRYTGFRSGVQSTSLMLAARYPFTLTNNVEAYVGLGLGAINVRYDGANQFPAFTGSQTVAGGQVSLGLRYQIDPRFGVFAELKHQRAFRDAIIVNQSVGYNATVGVVGFRVAF